MVLNLVNLGWHTRPVDSVNVFHMTFDRSFLVT